MSLATRSAEDVRNILFSFKFENRSDEFQTHRHTGERGQMSVSGVPGAGRSRDLGSSCRDKTDTIVFFSDLLVALRTTCSQRQTSIPDPSTMAGNAIPSTSIAQKRLWTVKKNADKARHSGFSVNPVTVLVPAHETPASEEQISDHVVSPIPISTSNSVVDVPAPHLEEDVVVAVPQISKECVEVVS